MALRLMLSLQASMCQLGSSQNGFHIVKSLTNTLVTDGDSSRS